MKRIVLCLISAAVLATALAASPALAQRGQKSAVPELDDESRKGEMARLAEKKAEEKFDAADEDRNGTLSRAEVIKHQPFIGQNFERYDKNKDGVLSWEEFVGHDKWKRKPKDAAAK